MNRDKILNLLFKEDYEEAYRLDSLLDAFNDDHLHDVEGVDRLSREMRPHGERVLDQHRFSYYGNSIFYPLACKVILV